jgi:hypothetical protein
MTSKSKILTFAKNESASVIRAELDTELANGYELKCVESLANSIRIYLIKNYSK